MLFKNPGFTVVAVFCLALGMGPNIALFTLADSFFLRELPVREVDRLVVIQAVDNRTMKPQGLSYLNYLDVTDRSEVFSDVVAEGQMRLNWSRGGATRLARTAATSENYFEALGISAEYGRMFSPADCAQTATCPVAVLSYPFWEREYASERNIVGQEILLNGRTFSIIGVTAKSFDGTDKLLQGPDIWLPLQAVRDLRLKAAGCQACGVSSRETKRLPPAEEGFDRETQWLRCIGVLHPGVSLEKAAASLEFVAWQLAQDHPVANRNLGFNVWFLRKGDPILRYAGMHIYLLLFAVTCFVLLTACANVANLLMTRGSAREQEFVMRAALGAGRWLLIRQLLLENLMLSLLAGGAGLLLAVWTIEVLSTLNLPFGISSPALNFRILAVAIACSVVTAIVFGLSPVLRISKVDLMSLLRGDPGTSGSSRRAVRRRNQLISTQVVASFVLLSCTALFVQGLQSVDDSDLGFQTENLLLGWLDFSSAGYSEAETKAFLFTLAARLRVRPFVRDIAFARYVPLDFVYGRSRVSAAANPEANNEDAEFAQVFPVTPEFFPALGIPILYGRNFDEGDFEPSGNAAIVNQTMAQRLWPGETALGKTFRANQVLSPEGRNLIVVGIAENSTCRRPGEKPALCMYLPYREFGDNIRVVASTTGDPASGLPALREEVHTLDPAILLTARTGEAHFDVARKPYRLAARFFGVFGGLAMALAIMGIYAIASFNVARRAREYAIRMACGANRVDILRHALAQMSRPMTSGMAVGFVLAVLIVRWLSSIFYGLSMLDLVTLFSSVFLLLLLTGTGTTLLAARKVTGLNPAVVLRHE